MALLTVNLDLVAAIREAGRTGEPDPAQAAVLAELAGADGIAVQIRRDRKVVRDRDLYLLKGIIKSKFIIELPPTDDLIEKVLEIKPWMAILVADHADADSPISPIEFGAAKLNFGDLTARLNAIGVVAGFFIAPEPEDAKGAAKAGASAVLIDCSGYTEARELQQAQSELDRIDRTAQAAAKADITVFAGRGISYRNIEPLIEMGNIDEFIIGQAICARAALVGFEAAISQMKPLLGKTSR